MKLNELKKALDKLGSEFDNCEVILQKDSEGNSYSPLYCIDEECVYANDILYSKDWDANDAGMEEDEWEELLKKPACIVLAP